MAGASDSITDADLLKLTAHDVVGAYAVVRGSVTVRRVCTGASGKSATYRAEITHVRVVCDNSKEHHAECMSKFAPLELMSPTFWYEQSLRSGSILRTVVPSTDPDVVDNFKASLIDVLGLTEGNCSVRGGREFNIVERLGGHHGHERPMRFHSMRVHNMAFGKDALASTSSRAVYALDVHGKTRSGRAAPHHFVHSSVDLKLVNVSNVIHSDRKFEDCSSIAARAREEEPTAATTLLETSASSHRTETSRRHREQTRTEFSPRDIAKFVESVATMAEDVHERIKKGKGVLISLASDIQTLVNTLLAPVPPAPAATCAEEALNNARKAVQWDPTATVDPVQAKRLLCKCTDSSTEEIEPAFRTEEICTTPSPEAENPLVQCHWIPGPVRARG